MFHLYIIYFIHVFIIGLLWFRLEVESFCFDFIIFFQKAQIMWKVGKFISQCTLPNIVSAHEQEKFICSFVFELSGFSPKAVVMARWLLFWIKEDDWSHWKKNSPEMRGYLAFPEKEEQSVCFFLTKDAKIIIFVGRCLWRNLNSQIIILVLNNNNNNKDLCSAKSVKSKALFTIKNI